MVRKSWRNDLEEVDESWTPSMLLSNEGVFPLEDVAQVLSVDTALLKSHAYDFEQKELDAKTHMGLENDEGRWLIYMATFSHYYVKNLADRIRRLEPQWDANVMLRQQGIYLLRDVCMLIPFTTGQIRYQVTKCRNSRKEIGVWKDKSVGTYLVDMSIFGKWIIGLWLGKAI